MGYHNEKFFLLYLIYTLAMGFVYVESSLTYINSEITDYSFIADNLLLLILLKIWFWAVTVTTYGMCFVFFFVAITFFLCIWSNLTMVERMQGLKFNCP